MAHPGEWLLSEEPVEINRGRATCKLTVRNTGDRPIQVGSHFHFFEANRALEFDRAKALGMRLCLPGGMAVRFEPGDEREVELVELGGMKRVVGFNALVDGGLTARWTLKRALARAARYDFKGAAATPLSEWADAADANDASSEPRDEEPSKRREGARR